MGKKRAVEAVPIKIEQQQKKMCFTRAFQFEESSLPVDDDAGVVTRPAVATASLVSLVVQVHWMVLLRLHWLPAHWLLRLRWLLRTVQWVSVQWRAV